MCIYNHYHEAILQMKIKDISHIKVYHGDNHNTTKLDPILMNNGNNQEGIGK